MKKYLAEMLGTVILVLMVCGTAVSLSCGVDTASVVGTSLAFGLSVVAPFVGATLSALVWKALSCDCSKCNK